MTKSPHIDKIKIGHDGMKSAFDISQEIYRTFLLIVIEGHILEKDREQKPTPERTQKKIDANQYVDLRVLRLAAISGKGGQADTAERQILYNRFMNISLLDHMLSVTRGSIIFAAVDLLTMNPDMAPLELKKRLAVVAVTAFLHDIDKDLSLNRNAPISPEMVDERMKRYGIGHFLEHYNTSISCNQMLHLIAKVEATQAHRYINAGSKPPPRIFIPLIRYIRLADQLDGTWLLNDPLKGGSNGVVLKLKKIEKEGSTRFQPGFFHRWKIVDIFDPHHSFLLDKLQRDLSVASVHLAGIPPLFEVHQDGRLVMLLPEKKYNAIIEKAFQLFSSHLPVGLELNVSNRGIPSLYNGKPTHNELKTFIDEKLKAKDYTDLFKIKKDLVMALDDNLDVLLENIDLEPSLSIQKTGALTSLYSNLNEIEENDEAKTHLHRATHLALLLNLKVDSKPKNIIPNSREREDKLIETITQEPPGWIRDIKDDASRRTITALWITVLADDDEDIFEAVWNENGLLKKWLEGDTSKNTPGFNQFFIGEGDRIIDQVVQRFRTLLNASFLKEDETANKKANPVKNNISTRKTSKKKRKEILQGRCLFTDEPVPFNQTVSQSLGLYGVKVSAFSGRDGRPESVTSEKAHTHIGLCAIAEHKERKKVHETQRGRAGGVPVLISSPATIGLFGGLGLNMDQAMRAMSLYDLNRQEIKKGTVLKGMEMYRGRCRMARLETFPEKTKDQIIFLRMLLTALRRTGRPMHMFRGLPVKQNRYFYFDAMPDVLKKLFSFNVLEKNAVTNGCSLHLEEIPKALQALEMAQLIMDTHGLGYDILKLYANRKTKFQAICLIWSHLRNKDAKNLKQPGKLYTMYEQFTEDDKMMTEQDGALVKLGKAATSIQKRGIGHSSANKELLVFKICFDTANAAIKELKQLEKKSLIYAIAGELETNLVRKNEAAANKHREGETLINSCIYVARLFVEDVWIGILKGKSPGQKTKRILSSIYRISFIKHSQKKI